MTRRRRKILGWLAVVGAALLAIGVAAWLFGPSWLRGTIERKATRTLGRQLSIAGRFDLSLSPTATLTAGDVTLANAPWGSEPAMVRARRLSVVFDLASLWSGPVRVHELELDGARVLLERDSGGAGNWELALPPRTPETSAEPRRVEIERATIRGVELLYRPAPDTEPVMLGVERIAATLDPPSRMIDLEGNGRLDETPWSLSGRIGTLEAIRAGHDLEQALTATLGDLRFDLNGRVRDPLALGGPDVEVRIEGPDLAAALGRFALASVPAVPFRLHARITPAENGVTVDGDGALGGVTLSAKGVVDSLAHPDRFDLEVAAAGADAAEVGSWLGSNALPRKAFELAGRIRREAGQLALDGVTARVGATRIEATGELGSAPRLVGTNLELRVSGPELTVLPSLARLRLPRGKFEAEGRLLRRADGFAIEAAELRSSGASVRATGTLGEPPGFSSLDLAVEASGPDLALLSSLARLRLPPGRFELEGRFLRAPEGFAIEGAELRTQGATLRATGPLGTSPGFSALNLAVEASGPDLALFSGTGGVELPSRSFELHGRVARDSAAKDGAVLRLDAVEGKLDDVAVSANGRLRFAQRLAGSDLRLRVAGPDLARFLRPAKPDLLPAEPFDAQGRLRIDPDGYAVDEAAATVGSLSAAGTARIAAPSALDGSPVSGSIRGSFSGSFAGHVEGAALSDLAVWGLPEGLPADRFSIDGRLGVDDGVYRADGVVATVGADRAELDGVLGALPELSGLDAALVLSGPSFAALARFAPALGLAAPAHLSAEPYSISGRARRQPAGIELDDVRAEARGTALRLNGIVGTGAGLRGTDLRLVVEAPDSSRLGELSGVALPAGPLEIRGHLARGDRGFSSDGITIAIGAARAQLSGTLGERPELEGTELQVDLSGPDFAAAFGPPSGRKGLPAEPFELGMELAGSSGQLTSRSFSARLGANDLSGRFSARFEGRPQVDAELQSRRLDLSTLFAGAGAETTNGSASPEAAQEPARGRLLSDEPLSFPALDRLDATVRFEAAELVVPGPARREVVFNGSLRNGVLRVDRFEGSGILGGRTRASLTLEPTANGYRMHLAGRLDGGRLVLTEAQESRESAPTVDLEVDLVGEGRSLHEIAASSNGHALVVAGPGRIQFRPEGERSEGAIRELVEALMPLRRTANHADVECGVALALVSGGEAEVDPIAVRTDKVNVTGVGGIDFATEEIDLSWRVKERQVTRISTGELANSYVKLGGTLAAPSIELKPLEALTAVGAAVATGGLTTLSKGVWNRLSADRKICSHALEEARRRLREHDPAAAP